MQLLIMSRVLMANVEDSYLYACSWLPPCPSKPLVNVFHFVNSLAIRIMFSFLPCARMRSRVMRLVASVCVRTYVYVYIFVDKKQAV